MMDTDSSSDEHSSSESSSTDSSSSDDYKLETVLLNGAAVRIPQGLCEKRDIFDEFFSVHTWNSLSELNKQHLRSFLPTFQENDEQEKNTTLQRLFNGDIFKFTSPMDNFYEHLKAGHYRPDIAKMRYLIRKAERNEAAWRQKKRKQHLAIEIQESRRKLFRQASTLPPGVEPRLPKPTGSTVNESLSYRTKRRYFHILSSIRAKVDESGFSSDDNYPDGPPSAISRKQKRQLNSLKSSHVLNGEKVIVSTMALKSNGFDLERHITPLNDPFSITEQNYKDLLVEHRKRKLENVDDQELDTKARNISDIIHRTKLNYDKKSNKLPVEVKVSRKKIKKEVVIEEVVYSTESDSDSIVEPIPAIAVPTPTVVTTVAPVVVPVVSPPPPPTPPPVKPKAKKVIKPPSPKLVIKQEIKVEEVVIPEVKPNYQLGKITPATLSDLDGIDMMNIPIDLDDSNIDLLGLNSKAELMQDTHANFLALIRDIICSTTEHRMDMHSLEDKLKVWQENPITALNDWYCLEDNWVSQLQSAVNFLSGNFPEQPDDFVPYIEYKLSLNMYQWIGAGRDTDNLLNPLCQYWLEHKNEMKPVISIKEKDDIELEVIDRAQTPPPPRCPTGWTVRKADAEDVKFYREQERRRYDNPHKSFTYRCNGYESVVGPLKGIYNPSVGNTKARGHTMLSADRPNFVTILSLVRDATARLPNGEGTRAEICELLKCSQYISPTAPDNVLQSVVSGALDRMHTQFDPCVKYDPKRKIWIYLHRNRSEEDFERLHQQYQGMSRTIKKPTKHKTPTKPKIKTEKLKNNIKIESVAVTEKIETPVIPQMKQTSVLIQSNSPKIVETRAESPKVIKLPRPTPQEEKEIKEALQAIQTPPPPPLPPPKPKPTKSVVKIITTQSKPIISPSIHTPPLQQHQQLKQENRLMTTKVTQISQTPQITQQLIQSIAQKQLNQQLIRVELPEKSDKKPNITIQQQILQSISPQQLQNIKNVTLLRNVRQTNANNCQQTIVLTQNDESKTIATTAENRIEHRLDVNTHTPTHSHTITPTHTHTLTPTHAQTPTPTIRVQHNNLTLSQQQQILQSIRQKGIPNLTGQQQVVLRHKSPLLHKTIQAVPGTSLLGQARVVTDTSKPIMTTGQGPLVAKVLTNAAGQVISVESLLAHQKQHGSLPQGTTLRVQGVKGGTNIIQLATANKSNQVVGSQNNYITLSSSQPKLVLSSTPMTTSVSTTLTTAKPIVKTVTKTQMVTKFPQKVAQQIINAKFITQNVDSKVVQPKMIIGQNQIKLGNKTVQTGKPVNIGSNNSIRMVNATNLNLAHLGGKPVLLASKGSTLQNIQGQNVIMHTQANTSNSSLVTLNTSKGIQSTAMNVINQSGQMVLTPQIKVQPQQVLLSSNVKNQGVVQNHTVSTGQIIVGGHQVRLQSSTANTQRVVLASQGQGGQLVAQQILLPAGFQGTAINIKSLQGVKVIPIAQAQQSNKGVQGRQVFARVMNPGIVRTASVSVAEVPNTTPTTE